MYNSEIASELKEFGLGEHVLQRVEELVNKAREEGNSEGIVVGQLSGDLPDEEYQRLGINYTLEQFEGIITQDDFDKKIAELKIRATIYNN